MENSKDIQAFKIGILFELNDEYRIPIYQRNYAWAKGQIEQLIQDIFDFSIENKKRTYYIGTLVVFNRQEKNKIIYETIDGQQRLTTLSILLRVLKNEFDINFNSNRILTYESRESANRTFDIMYGSEEVNFIGSYNSNMRDAYEIIRSYINSKIKKENNLDSFKKYLLNHVEILRISVPDDTDLNHYFEIMNNRGEQLEKHEVLKSKMLSQLNELERIVFSKIWDACSDMTRYVQYGFSSEYRKNIFGKRWNEFHHKNFNDLINILREDENKISTNFSINEILDFNKKVDKEIEEGQRRQSERFTSPVNFQNFLLHVLRIQIVQSTCDLDKDIALDDKRLIDSFDTYLNSDFVKSFAFNLLKTKYLFDNYVLKRDYTKDNEDGEWSLKKLFYGKKSAQYNNSFGEDNLNNEKITKLLSMFHVSNPSQIYKHWLTGVLNFLINENVNDISDLKYMNFLEKQALLFLKNRYLAYEETDYHKIIFGTPAINTNINLSKLDMGTNVENFIFNYLDYLLWRNDTEKQYSRFNFTFRSSVEHFYPQNPLDGQKRLQDESAKEEFLDSFGNLCLISSSKNSKFSNLQPGGKKSHYKGFDGISPKQYLMMDKAHSWWKDEIQEHKNKMLEVLGLKNELK